MAADRSGAVAPAPQVGKRHPGGVIFYGDPHGEWRPLLRACADDPPDGVVVLGDCDLAVPFREQLQPLFAAGIRVRWVHGNHDNDSLEWHDRLWVDYPAGDLHGAWAWLGGMTVAGLGGVFKERVWYPRFDMAAPVYASRRDYLRQVRQSDRFRGGIPLSQRDAIFPEDISALAKLRADVLAVHEAPTTHTHGFVGIDAAASACRARLIVHGHHHTSCEGVLPDGTRSRGLGRAEVFRLTRDELASPDAFFPPGEYKSADE